MRLETLTHLEIMLSQRLPTQLIFGKKNKIEFDAREGPRERTQDIFVHPESYSFVHNYKVHFKMGTLQIFADKVDISITSSSYHLPSVQQVTDQFNNQMLMLMTNPKMHTRGRRIPSFHITNIEYKESIAFVLNSVNARGAVGIPLQPTALLATEEPLLCRSCGTRLTSGSKFCNECGMSVTQE